MTNDNLVEMLNGFKSDLVQAGFDAGKDLILSSLDVWIAENIKAGKSNFTKEDLDVFIKVGREQQFKID